MPFRVEIIIIFAKSVKAGLNYLINECGADIDVIPEQEKFTCAITGKANDHEGLPSYYMIYKKDSFNIGILAHECFHAVIRIANDKGCKFNLESEEFYTYAIEDMVNSILENKDK
jgi:hypothetical protein